jgi:hypothetical protein
LELLRTPDERTADLPAYPYEPWYVDGDGVRMAYADEGPPGGSPALLLHGEPSWGPPLPVDGLAPRRGGTPRCRARRTIGAVIS